MTKKLDDVQKQVLSLEKKIALLERRLADQEKSVNGFRGKAIDATRRLEDGVKFLKDGYSSVLDKTTLLNSAIKKVDQGVEGKFSILQKEIKEKHDSQRQYTVEVEKILRKESESGDLAVKDWVRRYFA